MRRYIVGGAVRDALLGRPVNDHDWVVVGSTPEAMRAAGYQPVGKDFPVFLHPQTHEEHALARTERKTAPGYRGFVVHADPNVTLEDDLRRRDLTINAIAKDEHGALIDPYGGQRDLEAKVLRHVSEAFAEDPVRILRLARFAARFHDFTIAPETIGRTYECAGPQEMTLADLVRLAGEYSGHPRPVLPLSPAVARLQAWLMEWLPGEPLLTRDNLASLQVPNIAREGAEGLEALDILPTPLAAVAPGILHQHSPATHMAELRARSR